jgi:hypothetical protein
MPIAWAVSPVPFESALDLSPILKVSLFFLRDPGLQIGHLAEKEPDVFCRIDATVLDPEFEAPNFPSHSS